MTEQWYEELRRQVALAEADIALGREVDPRRWMGETMGVATSARDTIHELWTKIKAIKAKIKDCRRTNFGEAAAVLTTESLLEAVRDTLMEIEDDLEALCLDWLDHKCYSSACERCKT